MANEHIVPRLAAGNPPKDSTLPAADLPVIAKCAIVFFKAISHTLIVITVVKLATAHMYTL